MESVSPSSSHERPDLSINTSPVPPVRPSVETSRRPRAGTTATNRTVDGLLSPENGRPTSSQFRLRRTNTLKASQEYSHQEPGLEPGIDPNSEGLDDPRINNLQGDSQITIVEFNEDRINPKLEIWGDQLEEFLAKPREDWVKVRWINCNGLAWDVIQQLAQHYKFHPLALEDILSNHTNNRPKCDWYSDHAFVIVPLLMLLDDSHLRGTCGGDDTPHKPKSFWRRIMNQHKPECRDDEEKRGGYVDSNSRNIVRTMQMAYGGPNSERVAYMETHSSLAPLGKIVHVEQVFVFLTSDGTVVSFFEISGDEIEPPILKRLAADNTSLRTSSDPSMMLQAIIDAVVDLSLPLIGAYQDTIAELELTVLTDPSIKQSQDLYILTSELSMLKSTIAPITTVITSLRDHKRSFVPKIKGLVGVEISDMTRTYLSDVLDHVDLILDNLETMKRAADNMIDLIFNTIGSLQNESMKQLTTITIVFLPLSFLAGYFGMNFEVFPAVNNGGSDTFFWKVASPVLLVTLIYCLRQVVGGDIVRSFQKRSIKVATNRRRRGVSIKRD
ncbi:hypothetical protein EDC01DRAFT_608658 [Geopyxis carbonaria]|nr:hypothetical protein EDC01DRAFT_608658 [Geopyxis carbonaria]